ncbi:hypothetical protein [Brevundimonas sp.]|uniref:hypothetical protein n=1 Tax=Brevundimonas sp. TaxID=1871086 RepID=UPI003D10013F
MTDTTSKFMDGLQRSWLLKLVWVIAPLGPLLVVALSKHGAGRWAEWLSTAALLFLFGGLATSYGFAIIERRQRRARLRALSPLQRMQMSDEANLVPMSERLRIADHPAIENLPRPIQSVIAFWGAPLPKSISAALVVLDLSIVVVLLAMVLMDDPMGDFSRRLGAPLLPYWPVFITLTGVLITLRVVGRLTQMHRHYTGEASTSGRHPFPAL